MSTASRNTLFHPTETEAEKNGPPAWLRKGRHICPINDDLTWTYTLATPWFDPSASLLRTDKLTTGKTTLCAGPAGLAAQRRSKRHDA